MIDKEVANRRYATYAQQHGCSITEAMDILDGPRERTYRVAFTITNGIAAANITTPRPMDEALVEELTRTLSAQRNDSVLVLAWSEVAR